MRIGSSLLVLACATATQAQIQIDQRTFGTSRAGEPLHVYAVTALSSDQADTRPALLVIAGVDAAHRVGIDVAELLANRDWSDAAELLETKTLYIIPNLNPDGMHWLTGDDGPSVELGRTRSPFDADRDGRLNEDPPDDLNGDGMIGMMRVFDPPARYGFDISMVAESDDPRLARQAKATDGEKGAFTLITEGIDNDGDGLFNEDGFGGPGSGVDLNRNFPTHFPEFEEGSGSIPLSEPETRSLVEWVQSRRNIVGVLVLGRGDSFLNAPPTGKYDQTGRIPKGLEKADEAYHQHLAKSYKKTVSMDNAPTPNHEGSLLSWAYADFGAWAFESAVWSRPQSANGTDDRETAGENDADEPASPPASPADERVNLIESGVPEEIAIFLTATPEERQEIADAFQASSQEEQAAKMAAVGELPPELQARMMAAIQQTAGGEVGDQPAAPPTVKPSPTKPNDSNDGKWLTYSDEQRDGEGFVEWTPFDHPQLGPVEIGGFVPGFRINAPAGLTHTLADEQASVIQSLLEALPVVEVNEPVIERLGERVWRVSVELCNPSFLPTSSTVGLKIRQPIAVDLVLDAKRIAVGRRIVIINRLLGSGDCERVEWVITGEAGEGIAIQVRSERFGIQEVQATLEGDQP